MPKRAGPRAKRIRCAVYTRKSSDEGLEQEFNSLHAQREACESFIASQRHEGWHALATHYDDGGHSGGTMDRPALKRLLGDIAAAKVDIVVVYKIDRLTRSLFDFAKIVEAFDAKGVSFAAVTQQFNTLTSMGRLTLNVLLSFAQFEREVTSERIRDKIAASKQKGMWMGGAVPLGYDAVNRKLKINAEEAKMVRLLFALYLKLGSVRALQAECHRLGLKTKERTLLDGRRIGGKALSHGHLYLILSNRLYIGRIPHKGRSYEGEHNAIIDAETWDKVQAQLAANAGRKRGRTSSKHPSSLAGLLFTADGVPFTPSHAVNHGRRYRYYIERPLVTPDAPKGSKPGHQANESGAELKPKGWRLPAHEIEQLVLSQVASFLKDRSAMLDALPLNYKSPDLVSAVLTRAAKLAGACEAGSPAGQVEIVTALVRRVMVRQDKVTIVIERNAFAIRRIAESFEKDKLRKALLVMATGSGKTRTVIALSDLLMRANWAKRILFLADRVALVNQATNAFKAFLPQASPVNLISDKSGHGRVYVSTYPTMMGPIDETRNGIRRFGPGHFDLIVIDEAHRSVYRKYKAIFDYFDSLLVGLTATPKDEVDRDTYALFDLERGIPTDAYDLDEAVSDGYLVPLKAVSVPLRFVREGIKYDDLSDEEKEEWDEIEWDEQGSIPDQIDAGAVNKWLFNEDTVDKVLEHLMTHGQKVADGDRLGKTIIFAKNHDHAQFIAKRFDTNYPHLAGKFARVIDFKTEYAQSLIDDFSEKDKAPHIAISVDMLDTGIDIPEVVNLVFFKIVRSKTKFWQMIGRGTRLCPDLFGPGQHKEFFYIFDFCQNFEFFNQNPAVTEGAGGESLSKRLFTARVALATQIEQQSKQQKTDELAALRGALIEHLKADVAGMTPDNFEVRPQRRLVEKFQKSEPWEKLGLDERAELIERLAGLPSAHEDDDLEAKQFDLLVLRTQLALLLNEKSFEGYRKRIRDLAALLEEKRNVPMVAAELELILEIQTDEFWQDITAPPLETVRRRLRSLIKLIEVKKRPHIYTDFEDELGSGADIAVSGAAVGTDKHRFRLKVRQFLNDHMDHITIQKLRRNEPLTPQDLEELERILIDSGIAEAEQLDALQVDGGLGVLIRSMVGLDREAAKRAFNAFTEKHNLNADQIEFLNMVIDYLTERGVMDPRSLYESPFTDLDYLGVEGLFGSAEVVELISIIEDFRKRAAA